ncbi:MAG: hypothetical protein U0804_09795 [Gemmataceae bacterium]
MITPPRRSVTRFFIPLIDVLILLFCIFLLMPFVSSPAADDDSKPAPKPPELPTDVAALQKQLAATQKERDEAQRRLDRFQKDRGERLVVRVLEIDPDTGKLYYYAPGRQEVAGQAQAEQLIAYQKRLAGEKDTYFLIMYPRRASGYPTRANVETYRAWFKDVPYGFDIP